MPPDILRECKDNMKKPKKWGLAIIFIKNES